MSKIYDGKFEVTHGNYDRLRQVLDQWHEAHRADYIRSGFGNRDAEATRQKMFDEIEVKHAHIGAKYTRLDVGSSGAWMLEDATGIIYNIKGYGKVDKKKIAGDISDPTFDGAILFRDRFRRGRFDNRRTGEFALGSFKPSASAVRTHPDEDVEKFNNGYRDGRPDDRDGSGQ